LKRQFALKRARYKGDAGFQRYVGWCIGGIAERTVVMATGLLDEWMQIDSGAAREWVQQARLNR